jgi:NADH:ubiquinone oxidoreductase subunit 4 (subunit M)
MTPWFEVAVVSTIFAAGNIVFGHFEERTPKWRRLLKMVLTLGVTVGISTAFGRVWFWAFLGAMLLPVLYIHAVWLPSKGINGWTGWTGEPRDKYYALRGWKQ